MSLRVSPLVLIPFTAFIAVACKNESTDPGSGASDSIATVGNASSATQATGTPTSASATGAGPTSGATSSSGGLDPMSTACADFPVTVMMGPTIDAQTGGAVLCFDDVSMACRLTTNTYSDGENPCPDASRVGGFYGGQFDRVSLGAPNNEWEIVSATAGTIDGSTLVDIPQATAVTAVIKKVSTQAEHTMVFRFEGGGNFTMTSFTAN